MRINSLTTNHHQSFKSLEISKQAEKLLKKEADATQKIEKYTKELKDSKYPVKIGYWKCADGSEHLSADLGNKRGGALTPAHLRDKYIMVYSAEIGGDNEDDVVETLKFPTAQRAQEVYDQLAKYFKNLHGNTSHLDYLDEVAFSAKILTEAEIIPNEQGPWEWFHEPIQEESTETQEPEKITTPEKKPFGERLKMAWNILMGK